MRSSGYVQTMSIFDRFVAGPRRPTLSSEPPLEKGPLLRSDGTPYVLALYAYDGCPYCQRVYRTLDALGVEVEMRNTMMDRQHRADLVEATGRSTVPCLFIDGQPMHESREIVRWLQARKAEQPA